MKNSFKHPKLKGLLFVLVGILVVYLIFWGFSWLTHGMSVWQDKIYETNSIEDYGVYIGNFDNETPTKFITSFFPETAEQPDATVSYSYKARSLDSTGCEAWLDYTFRDEDAFYAYIQGLEQQYTFEKFPYHEDYMVYTACDRIQVDPESTKEDYSLDDVKIGKILYSPAELRVIYAAIIVYDGGGTDEEIVNRFFGTFDIDPMEYEKALEKSGSISGTD